MVCVCVQRAERKRRKQQQPVPSAQGQSVEASSTSSSILSSQVRNSPSSSKNQKEPRNSRGRGGGGGGGAIPKKSKGGPAPDSATPTPEAIARAARQAELFAQHDIAREQARAALGHHPLRVQGQPLLGSDMREVLIGDIGGELRIGQLVAVPRSTGGLCYGEVVAPVKGERCFWLPSVQHAESLVRIQYGSRQKLIPSLLVGRLPLAPGAQNTLTEIESLDSMKRPLIGDPVSSRDIASIQLEAGNKFVTGELVAVSRSGGGFTIGRIDTLRALPCPSCPPNNAPHQVAAYRIITEDADDESPAKFKVVAAALIGKLLAPWAAQQRQELSQLAASEAGAGPSAVSSSSVAAPLLASGAKDELLDEEVERKLRERFGDFTPFLDDEDEDDNNSSNIALQELEPDSSSSFPSTNNSGAPNVIGNGSQWNSLFPSEPLFFGFSVTK